jgi:hypothetical protein
MNLICAAGQVLELKLPPCFSLNRDSTNFHNLCAVSATIPGHRAEPLDPLFPFLSPQDK